MHKPRPNEKYFYSAMKYALILGPGYTQRLRQFNCKALKITRVAIVSESKVWKPFVTSTNIFIGFFKMGMYIIDMK